MSRVDVLLRAARRETAPPGNEARLLAALGLEEATAAPRSGRAMAWLRWLGLGAILVGTVVIAPPRPAPEPFDPPPAERPALPPVLAAVTLAAHAASEPARRAPFVTLAPPRARTAPTSDDELAILQDAKLSLGRGDAVAALTALDRHTRAFPGGVFGEEAAALRVEALVAVGRLEEARRAGEAFEAAFPRSPYGPRLRTLQSHRTIRAVPAETPVGPPRALAPRE